MTVQEMHTAVKLLLDKADSLNYPNYKSEEIDFFLNLAQDRFVKHRYDGAQSRNRGFEETQKRMDDLRNIASNAQLTPQAAQVGVNYPNGRFVTLPSTPAVDKYLFSITEQITATFPECGGKKPVISGQIKKDTTYIVTSGSIVYDTVVYDAATGPVTFNSVQAIFGGSGTPQTITTFTGTGTVYVAETARIDVKPIQHDDYNKIIRDPFNKPVIDQDNKLALRLELNGQFEIILPDANTIFSNLNMRYIREPRRISLSSTPAVDCELADHTHQEIVDMAVSSMLENIESDRYKSHLNELNKLE